MEITRIIDGLFIFSLYWSVGASVVTKDRKQFDIFVRRLLDGDEVDIDGNEIKTVRKIDMPRSLAYRFIFAKSSTSGKFEWTKWEDLIDDSITFPKKMKPENILVPT